MRDDAAMGIVGVPLGGLIELSSVIIVWSLVIIAFDTVITSGFTSRSSTLITEDAFDKFVRQMFELLTSLRSFDTFLGSRPDAILIF